MVYVVGKMLKDIGMGVGKGTVVSFVPLFGCYLVFFVICFSCYFGRGGGGMYS